MKKIIVILMALTAFVSMRGQSLYFVDNTASAHVAKCEEIRRFEIAGQEIHIVGHDEARIATYPMTDGMSLELRPGISTGIDVVEDSRVSVIINNGFLNVSGLNQDAIGFLYDLQGHIIQTYTLSKDVENVLPLSDIVRGCYIFAVDKEAVKFVK